jgi:outer membrane beta-barrel protein
MSKYKYLIKILILFGVTSQSIASEDDLYDFLWLDPDKAVYVLQNKIHKKEKSLFLSGGYASSLNTDFQNTQGGTIEAGYWLNETIALSLQHAVFSSKNDEAYKNITRVNNIEPFVRRAQSYTNFWVHWTPFYGKINTFNKIYYFDVGFAAGIGSLNMESNLRTLDDTNVVGVYDAEKFTSLGAKGFIKFYPSPKTFISIELINNSYKASSPGNQNNKQIKHLRDFTLNFGFKF